ncbi:MOSC domain-containing protein [Paenibacillus sp. sptzw28]|nr:MOSC domain-containing protein [Paenibacillus sp. sptzw28]
MKSMAGEHLNQAQFAAYGLYGDRSHALIDESLEGWERYFTAREIPDLLGYKAAFTEGSCPDEFPGLQITSPGGEVFYWDDRLLQEIQKFSNRTISLLRHSPDNEKLLAVDTEGILIINDRSLNKLETILGRGVDKRRFRANLVISLMNGCITDETQLVGKRLSIGSTRLHVTQECERCSMITIDPDTYNRDISILKKLNEEMNLNFGVYASVLAQGNAGIGDTVFITE